MVYSAVINEHFAALEGYIKYCVILLGKEILINNTDF